MIIRLFLLSMVFAFAFSGASYACLGFSLHTSVFLDSLPVKAMEKDFVALVEIEEDSKVEFQRGGDNSVKIKILNLIKGEAPQHGTMTITVPLHTCYNGHDLKKGDKAFLAGKLENGEFIGEWKEADKR